MISFEQARQIALDKIGPDCGLINEATGEKPYGWYFCYQSKAYQESGRMEDMLIGHGGFLVEKMDGRVVEFGSVYPLGRYFELYEAGFKYRAYDLTISRIYDLNQTLDFLQRLPLGYVIPEVEHGVTWRIPRMYTRKQFKKMLARLPCIFTECHFYFDYGAYEVFQKMTKSCCCEFQLTEHRPDAFS